MWIITCDENEKVAVDWFENSILQDKVSSQQGW